MTEFMVFVGMFVAFVAAGEMVARFVTRPRTCRVAFRPLVGREG